MQPAFVVWRKRQDREELEPKPKASWTFGGRESGSQEASPRVGVRRQAMSLHEMRKKQQKEKHARYKCEGPKWLGKNSDQTMKIWGKAHFGWRGAGSVQAMHGAVWGPKLMNRCRPEKKDTTEYGYGNNPQTRRKEGCQTETRKDGKFNEKTEVLRGKSGKGRGMNLTLEGSWHKMTRGTLPKRGCLRTKELCLQSHRKLMQSFFVLGNK